jgi:transposase
MDKSRFYLGVDVGASELWVAASERKPRLFAHSTKGIRAMQKWARQMSNNTVLHFCMEATGVYSQSLANQLISNVDTEVSIINPAQIAAFAKAKLKRTKTDSVDARIIFEFAINQEPQAWAPESESLQQMYELVTQADAIRDDIQRWNNRAHANSYKSDLPKEVIKVQRTLLRAMKRQRDILDKAITELCKADQTLKTQVDLLCTIPGVHQLTATRLLVHGKSALTERSQKALTAYAGLDPSHRQSGTSLRGKSRISKKGNKHIRKTLYMPAMCCIVHNPVISKHYQRLLKKGKLKMVALTACMRKLLLMVRAILIKQQPFNPEINA